MTVTGPSALTQQKKTDDGSSRVASQMDADTFMKLFTTQLANQNPMEPQDSADFLNQFSQITSVQTMSDLQKTMGDVKSNLSLLTQLTQAVQAQGFLGRSVQYTDAAGTVMTSQVEAVRLADGSAQLVVNGGKLITIESVRQVLPGTTNVQP
jgi:flagellar basal-body rod modification protein FlgD